MNLIDIAKSYSETIIVAWQEGRGFHASVPVGFSTKPEEIEEEGLSVCLDGKVTETYCPKVLFQGPDGRYQACGYFCRSKGARDKMCSNRQHGICATYDPSNADYHAIEEKKGDLEDNSKDEREVRSSNGSGDPIEFLHYPKLVKPGSNGKPKSNCIAIDYELCAVS